MDKLIDFDGLFDQKLAEYMEENAGKYTEKQWENIIPKLYRQFGDTFIKRAGDTPRGYYGKMSDRELVETLVRHVREGVPVSDFLCSELETRDCPPELLALLSESDTELLTFAVNTIGANEKAIDGYFGILKRPEADGDVVETVCEQLKASADKAKTRALGFYEAGVRKELMLEILSRCKERDDRIFEILLNEFKTSDEEIPMHASYLAAYGDERALPVLLEYIDRDETNYLEYQELKYAIEALGGEYTRIRDFSDDPYYREILEQSSLSPETTDSKTVN